MVVYLKMRKPCLSGKGRAFIMRQLPGGRIDVRVKED